MMAEGTDTGEMPSFDPSPSSEAKKRPTSSDGSEWCSVCVCCLEMTNSISGFLIYCLCFPVTSSYPNRPLHILYYTFVTILRCMQSSVIEGNVDLLILGQSKHIKLCQVCQAHEQ